MIQAVCAAVVFVVTILVFYGTFCPCLCSKSHWLISGIKRLLFQYHLSLNFDLASKERFCRLKASKLGWYYKVEKIRGYILGFRLEEWLILLRVLQTQWWLENIHQNQFTCTVTYKRIRFEILELHQTSWQLVLALQSSSLKPECF